MTWRYEQSTGRLWHLVAIGYSGADPDPSVKGEAGEGKNTPADEELRNIGPIPQGVWTIGAPFDGGTKGPYVMRLLPGPGTDTHGRSGFLIHGDSVKHPGTASQGCIILGPVVRRQVWESGDHELEVVP